MSKRVDLYDTTLRDGAQGEGISFSAGGKVKMALRLDQFGVDFIEGGYPMSNPKDMEFFKEIRQHRLKHARLAAFGSTRRNGVRADRDEGLAGLLQAHTAVVTIVGKAWELHVRDVLRTSSEENLAMIADTVRFLKARGKEVFFDAEHFFDGYKDNPDFALRMIGAAAEAGADLLVLCDTNGGSLPNEIFAITQAAVKTAGVAIGIHAHNDGGLAVANTLEAVRAGAVQVQGTINGYGERCGNANLCTVIANLQLKMGRKVVPAAALRELRQLSIYAGDIVNVRPDTRAPYVGESAFGHKGGLHVNAVQKNPRSFEHIAPAVVGNERRILMSEGSGTSSVLMKASELGIAVDKTSTEVKEVLRALKELEHHGFAFEAADASFRILIQKVLKKHKSFFDLEGFRVIVEKRGKNEPCLSEATVKVRVGGEMEQAVAEGDGPVNALDRALRKVLLRFYPAIAKVYLSDFRVRILDSGEGTAAKTRVIIESSDGESTWGTVGVSENIIEACWQALQDSVEYKLFREEERKQANPPKGKKAGGRKRM